MQWRRATTEDVPELARLNRQLIEDEGHDNPMDLSQLEQRMARWLAGRYRAVLFSDAGRTVAYALYLDDERGGHHVRQLFVARDVRRRGHGRRAMELLMDEVLRTGARVSLEVLEGNGPARAFYAALGFSPYAITLERSSPEARVGAFNYLQATERIATSGVVAAAGFERIAAAGYRSVVNLLPADSEHALADEREWVEALGMDYVHVPVDFKRPSAEDFEEVAEALRDAGDAKVWVHCAANFRVSVFVGLYAEQYLGWPRVAADALIARVWEPDPVWRAFLARMRGS